MSRTARNLTGQVFGRLTVIERAPDKKSAAMWVAECDCGNVRSYVSWNLINGKSTSCGCYRRDRAKKQMDSVWAAAKAGGWSADRPDTLNSAPE